MERKPSSDEPASKKAKVEEVDKSTGEPGVAGTPEGSDVNNTLAGDDSGIVIEDLPVDMKAVKAQFLDALLLGGHDYRDIFCRTYQENSPAAAPNPCLWDRTFPRPIGLPYHPSSSQVQFLQEASLQKSDIVSCNQVWRTWLGDRIGEVGQALGLGTRLIMQARAIAAVPSGPLALPVRYANAATSFASFAVVLPSFGGQMAVDFTSPDLVTSVALQGSTFDTTVLAWYHGTEVAFKHPEGSSPRAVLLYECFPGSPVDASRPLEPSIPRPVPRGRLTQLRRLRDSLRQWKSAYITGEAPRRMCYLLESYADVSSAPAGTEELVGTAGTAAQLLQEAAKAEGFQASFLRVTATVTGKVEASSCRQKSKDGMHFICSEHTFRNDNVPHHIELSVTATDPADGLSTSLRISKKDFWTDLPFRMQPVGESLVVDGNIDQKRYSSVMVVVPDTERERLLMESLPGEEVLEKIRERMTRREEEAGGGLEELEDLFSALGKQRWISKCSFDRVNTTIISSVVERKDLQLFRLAVQHLLLCKGRLRSCIRDNGNFLLIGFLDAFGFEEVSGLFDIVFGGVCQFTHSGDLDLLAEIGGRAGIPPEWLQAAYKKVLSPPCKVDANDVATLVKMLDLVGNQAFPSLVLPVLPPPDLVAPRGLWLPLITATAASKYPQAATHLLDRAAALLPIDESTPDAFAALVPVALKYGAAATSLPIAFIRLEEALEAAGDYASVRTYKTVALLFQEHAEAGGSLPRMLYTMLDGYKSDVVASLVKRSEFANLACPRTSPAFCSGLLTLATSACQLARDLNSQEPLEALARSLEGKAHDAGVQSLRVPLCKEQVKLYGSPTPPALVKMLNDTLTDFLSLIGPAPSTTYQPLRPLKCDEQVNHLECFDCQRVNDFLAEGEQLEFRLAEKQKQRDHVEAMLRRRGTTDLQVTTLCVGRPYSLVLQKQGVASAAVWRGQKQRELESFVKAVAPTQARFTELFGAEKLQQCGFTY